MCLMLNNYQCKASKYRYVSIYMNPHGNHKSKTYTKFIKKKPKKLKDTTK